MFLLIMAFVLILVGIGFAVVLIADSRRLAAQSGRVISSFDQLTLERTECFGSCPAYRITVSGSGDVRYDGYNFVDTKGPVNDRLTTTQLGELVAAINECSFFALRESYQSDLDGCPALVSDTSSAIISVTVEGKTKRIQHYIGCVERRRNTSEDFVFHPLKLYSLEERVDEVVGTKRWIKRTSSQVTVEAAPHNVVPTSPG
jgi:hypothetical protein